MLSIVVLACYLACAAWLASSAFHPDEPRANGRRVAGLALGATALLLHAALLRQGLFAKPTISFTTTETASLIGWPMGLIALGLSWLKPRFSSIGAVLMVGAGIVAMATVEGSGGYALTRQNWEVAAHIALSTLAYALIMITAVLAIAQALLDQRLRRRRPLGWLRVMPSLESLEAGTFQALGAGFAVLTLALFSGFIFVSNLFAQHLFHKTVLSCVAWIIFAVVLFGRWRFGWRGRAATSWTLGGFALLGLAYFGSKIVLETVLGRHWT